MTVASSPVRDIGFATAWLMVPFMDVDPLSAVLLRWCVRVCTIPMGHLCSACEFLVPPLIGVCQGVPVKDCVALRASGSYCVIVYRSVVFMCFNRSRCAGLGGPNVVEDLLAMVGGSSFDPPP